jgi:hypothetical protein
MEGYWAMGQSVGSHGVSKFAITQGRGAISAEDGQDRMLLETDLGRRVEAKLAEMLERTRSLLEENHYEVLAVAHALETHKTVSGDDVIAVIEGKQGPIVDGRPYPSREFRQLADAYHERALAAHKGHSQLVEPLPTLMPLPAAREADGDGEADSEGRGAGVTGRATP